MVADPRPVQAAVLGLSVLALLVLTPAPVAAQSHGVTVSPTELRLSEAGGTATYTLVLDTPPLAFPLEEVTITPSSGDTSLVTVSGAPMFTFSNWSTPQTVTVRVAGGADNQDRDPGAQRTVTITHSITSTGDRYGTVPVSPVTVRVLDDDTPRGVTVSPTELTLSETGGTATYTLVLDTPPGAPEEVTITPSSGDTSLVTVSGAPMFTVDNWNTPQTVTVRVAGSADNQVQDPGGQRTVTITHSISSFRGFYGTVPVSPVTVRVLDNDRPRGVTVSPTELTLSETGGTAAYTLVLDTPPGAPEEVTITPSSGDTSLVTVSGTGMFTASNWHTPQTVTVRVAGGADNDIPDPGGQRTATITHSIRSFRGIYGTVPVSPVTVRVVDNEVQPPVEVPPGVTVSAAALTVSEPEGTATYTVVLDTVPTGGVRVRPTSGDTGAALVTPTTVRFTPDNWNTPQTVTVTAVDDDEDNPGGQRTTSIAHAVTGYGNVVTARPVRVTVHDDDDENSLGQPTVVTATSVAEGVKVSWNAARNAERYKVQWKSGAQDWDPAARQLVTTELTVTIPDLESGTEYTVRVIGARSEGPDGPPSSELVITAGITDVPALPLFGQLLLALLLLAGGARLHRRQG